MAMTEEPEIYSPIEVKKVFYPMPDNRIYDQQMSEVQGLSRLYLDGEVNLDTLRIFEIQTEKRIRQRYDRLLADSHE